MSDHRTGYETGYKVAMNDFAKEREALRARAEQAEKERDAARMNCEALQAVADAARDVFQVHDPCRCEYILKTELELQRALARLDGEEK